MPPDRFAALTGFDRIMIYRFAANGVGEVIAEVAKPGMESYSGASLSRIGYPRPGKSAVSAQFISNHCGVRAAHGPALVIRRGIAGTARSLVGRHTSGVPSAYRILAQYGGRRIGVHLRHHRREALGADCLSSRQGEIAHLRHENGRGTVWPNVLDDPRESLEASRPTIRIARARGRRPRC